MADLRAIVINIGGDKAEVRNADAVVVGTGVKAAGTSNLTLTPGTAANVRVSGDALVLNGDHSGTGEDTFLYAYRGTSTAVAIRWYEADDKWQCSNDGVTWRDLGQPTGAANQHLEYVGSEWTAVNDLRLPAGSRTIDIASAPTGSQLQVAGGAATLTNTDGGDAELIGGAPGGGTGLYGEIRIGTNAAGAARASTIRIGYDDSGGNQIEVNEANYTTDLNGNISFGAADAGTRITTDIVWSHSASGERRLRVMAPTTADADSNTIKIEGASGSNNASGNGYKGTYLYLDAGAGGDSSGSDGDGGAGGGSDYYGGTGGAGNGSGGGGSGGPIALHGGNGGASGATGSDGNGADIVLKPGMSLADGTGDGYHGAVVVGNPNATTYTYLLFDNDDGVGGDGSDPADGPGLRWSVATDAMQMYTGGATGAGSWVDIAASADEWIEIPTSEYTATPASTSTITLSNTDWMDLLVKGTPIKWLVQGGVGGVSVVGGSPYMLSGESLTGLSAAHVGAGGIIYVNCVNVSGTTYRFDLYSSPALDTSHKLAHTNDFNHTTSAAQNLIADNSSGLGGSLTNVASGCRGELFGLVVMWAGVVADAVRSGGNVTLTIAGAPLVISSATILGLWVGPAEKVRKERLTFGATTLVATTDTFCLTAKVAPVETIGPFTQLVKFRAYASDVSTGVSRVNLMNNGNEVSSTSSHNGLLIAAADTWYETGVDLDRDSLFVTSGDDIDVAVKVAEATARYLTVEFFHVVL